MKIKKIVSTGAVSGILALSLSGAALADASISDTGPSSNNTATVENNNTTTINNRSSFTVTNSNTQTGTSGEASVEGNTKGGNATSGSVSNTSTTTTTINASSSPCCGGKGGGQGGGGAGGGSNPGTTSQSSGGGKGGGSLTKASGLGGGTLPRTGPTDTVDVSAIRAAWQPTAPAAEVVKKTNNVSRALLAAGALLSLLGAFGSAYYTNKKQVKV